MRQRGFSLIELMITVSVMVLLMALAVPSMFQFTENSKVLATAEMFYVSAQRARTEAIRRNAVVEVVFTDQAAAASSVDTTGLTTTGPNWLIRAAPPAGGSDHVFIDAKAGSEGAGSRAVVIGSSVDAIQFDASGALVGGTAATVNFSSAGGACEPDGGIRCLRVVVLSGGQARLCDPVVSAASDTRKC